MIFWLDSFYTKLKKKLSDYLIIYLDEQIIENLFITNSAIMRGLVFAATMESDSKAFNLHKRLSRYWNPKALLQNFPNLPKAPAKVKKSLK